MSVMKRTCALCPYSKTKTLGLHPYRALEFALSAAQPDNDFPCHKTAEYEDEDANGEGGGYVSGPKSKTCHGFRTLQLSLTFQRDSNFSPDGDGFTDFVDMVNAHKAIEEARSPPHKKAS